MITRKSIVLKNEVGGKTRHKRTDNVLQFKVKQCIVIYVIYDHTISVCLT